jgi:hypothetical protein
VAKNCFEDYPPVGGNNISEGSMKKLFVLFLCLAAAVGFIWAGAVRPPGIPELPGYGVGCEAVAPDTVLAIETPLRGFHDQILAVPDIMASGLPQAGNPVLPDVPAAGVDYPLRL